MFMSDLSDLSNLDNLSCLGDCSYLGIRSNLGDLRAILG